MSTRILVVDDSEGDCTLVEMLLRSEGYEVATAKDGCQGLRTFYDWHPSLIVLDLLMPGMDGWEFLECIREVSDIPVLIISALAEERHKVRGFNGGADEYIVKPFRPAEFQARVFATLRRANLSRSLRPGAGDL